MLLVNSTSTINIALLFLYAISLRFIMFDYVIAANFWQRLVEKINQKVIASTKTTTKKGGLLIYFPETKPDIYWYGLNKIIEKLVRCPFCKGCWAGYIIYFLLILDFNNLSLDIQQVMDFALFSWSCGIISLVTTSKLAI